MRPVRLGTQTLGAEAAYQLAHGRHGYVHEIVENPWLGLQEGREDECAIP